MPAGLLPAARQSPALRLVLRSDGTPRPRRERVQLIRQYSEDELAALRRDWRFWARPDQLEPPGEWFVWANVKGRGAGKTRTGAEWCLDRAETFAEHGAHHRGALIARTVADCRDVMIEGESGLLECAERRGHHADYEPSKRRLTLPDLGSIFTTFTAEKPDQVRGHQFHTAWADEPAAWRHLVDREGNTAWTNLTLALRLEGVVPADWTLDDDLDVDDLPPVEPPPPELQPRICATTTPKPIPLVTGWVKLHTQGDPSLVLSTGSLYDNVANLSPRFVAEVRDRYKGTRLEAQEIEGLLLDTVEGALWDPEIIDRHRWRGTLDAARERCGRVVVAVDPSGSTTGDECGIMILGLESDPVDPGRRHLYVLDDQSVQNRPEVWAKVSVDAFYRWQATTIAAEVNFGAALVVDVLALTDRRVPVFEVRASRGKRPRAEPVSLLYEQGRVHHVGTFGLLEAQMCTWVPDEDDSPDRMDALVWGAHYLLPEIALPPAQDRSAAAMRIPTGAAGARRGESRGDVVPFPGFTR